MRQEGRAGHAEREKAQPGARRRHVDKTVGQGDEPDGQAALGPEAGGSRE
jgi:hypothetical protein